MAMHAPHLRPSMEIDYHVSYLSIIKKDTQEDITTKNDQAYMIKVRQTPANQVTLSRHWK
jgi:hypothetical protein